MRFPALLCLLILLFVPLAGCSKVPVEVAQEDEAYEIVKLTPKERALRAKEALAKELSTRLLMAMSGGGPTIAINVCAQAAQGIAKEVGEIHGVTIGRTSFKLRNPENAPPEWAAVLIEKKVTEPKFLELSEGRTGALFPIHLKAQCLVCHGEMEQLSERVIERLAKLYPEDEATGFKEGDLRGWFWVEVPDRS